MLLEDIIKYHLVPILIGSGLTLFFYVLISLGMIVYGG